jgi:hypothetical protein
MACFNSEKQTTKNKTYLCFFAFLRAGTPASVMAEGVWRSFAGRSLARWAPLLAARREQRPPQ